MRKWKIIKGFKTAYYGKSNKGKGII